MNPLVAVLKTTPDTVLQDYHTLLTHARLIESLKPQAKTLLALDTCWDRFFPSSSAPPWQLEGFLQAFRAVGRISSDINALSITSMPMGTKIDRVSDGAFKSVLRKYGVSPDDLPCQASQNVWADRNVVVFSTLKTHLFHYASGSVIPSALLAEQKRRPAGLFITAKEIVEKYRKLKASAASVTGLLDGTLAGDGPGPQCLRPFVKNYILAGQDLVALDAVAAHMMGFPPMSVPYLRQAHEEGLGCAAIDRISVVGADIRGLDFRFHHTGGISSERYFRVIREHFSNKEPFRAQKRIRAFIFAYLASRFIQGAWFRKIGRTRMRNCFGTGYGKLLFEYGLRP